jgi:hypothetical protein
MAVPDEQVRHQRNARGDRDIRQSDNPGVSGAKPYTSAAKSLSIVTRTRPLAAAISSSLASPGSGSVAKPQAHRGPRPPTIQPARGQHSDQSGIST